MTIPRRALTPPDAPVWRVGRGDRPWSYPDWKYAAHGRFPNRWDDPQGQYRVVYGSTTRIGALVESLQAFRPKAGLVKKLAALGAADAIEPGTVPPSWLGPRSIASAVLKGSYADVQHHEWIAYLHQHLRPRFKEWGITELDGAILRSTETRGVTRAASRLVYEASLSAVDQLPAYSGVAYESRFGNDMQCWAVFEYADIAETPFTQVSLDQLRPYDPDLVAACQILGIHYP